MKNLNIYQGRKRIRKQNKCLRGEFSKKNEEQQDMFDETYQKPCVGLYMYDHDFVVCLIGYPWAKQVLG